MSIGRTEEDLLNPGRVFYRLIDDYSKGRLTRPWLKLHRAMVVAVDPDGGNLEASPPNPPNSIRARIYSSGLDVNIPNMALTIFHPLLPGHLSPTLNIGEHVYVVFEDSNYSHGLWISGISSYQNLNFANPDERESEQSDASHAFEGDSGTQTVINNLWERGGATIQTQGNQELVSRFETSDRTNPWRNKRVLMIGDSQVYGPLSRVVERKLTSEHNISFFHKDGRVGWGVSHWISGRHPRNGDRQFVSLSTLINQYSINALIIVLGGNDGAGRGGRADYTELIQNLWSQASSVSLKLWGGPPVAVLDNSHLQPGRDRVSQKIRSVVGNNFVNSAEVTNTTQGRTRDGVHFTSNSQALEPWANLLIQKGYQLG